RSPPALPPAPSGFVVPAFLSRVVVQHQRRDGARRSLGRSGVELGVSVVRRQAGRVAVSLERARPHDDRLAHLSRSRRPQARSSSYLSGEHGAGCSTKARNVCRANANLMCRSSISFMTTASRVSSGGSLSAWARSWLRSRRPLKYAGLSR